MPLLHPKHEGSQKALSSIPTLFLRFQMSSHNNKALKIKGISTQF